MRTLAIVGLAALLMNCCLAGTVAVDQLDLKSGDDFVAEVQGANNNTYIIIFQKTDTDYLKDLKSALDAAPQDEILQGYDYWQADFDQPDESDPDAKPAPHIKIGSIDVRDQSEYADALDLIGANDPNFKMTFPVTLLSKAGNGFLASFTQFTQNGKIAQHLREKLIAVTGAQKKKNTGGAAAGGEAQ